MTLIQEVGLKPKLLGGVPQYYFHGSILFGVGLLDISITSRHPFKPVGVVYCQRNNLARVFFFF